ncbi:PKD-channel domain-containing protein [Aphelenchoides bicaudatus]|nr:PKD-channel domain-containing protein [Aphelenchoides bicaudatus]
MNKRTMFQNRTGPAEGDDEDQERLFDSMNDSIIHDFNTMIDDLDEHKKSYAEKLRRHLQFFFMNPKQKYKIRKQIPFKLVIQVLKVFFITYQIYLFAEMRINHVDFLEDTVTVMRHKFLRDWDHARDAVSYPPETERYTIFSSNEIIEHMSHITLAYYSLQNESFASFSYDSSHVGASNNKRLQAIAFDQIPPMELCINKIADVKLENQTYIFDVSEQTDCMKLDFNETEVNNMKHDEYYIAKAFVERNITFKPEDALIISKATLRLNLRTIHFSPVSMDKVPECYLIKLLIEFDNSKHTGQVYVNLKAAINYVNLCNGRVLEVSKITLDTILVITIDVAVLVLCLASFVLCCRALLKAFVLQSKTADFFETTLKHRLDFADKMEFLNLWYVIIVSNDCLIILGTICKVSIEFRDFDNGLFTLTGILLGIGALLVYFGLLRYLGFFSQYNILILTLKKSAPSIGRFMVCTIILYFGFLFAGWIIIGPYSIKFRTLSGSSEALFSLLNGDDMFVTFSTISDSNTVISVFIAKFSAIIMDAYEIVKQRHNQELVTKTSTLQEFLASAEPPTNLDDIEIRGQYAADQLLRLESPVLNYLHNQWQTLRLRMRRGDQFPYNNFDNHNTANNLDSTAGNMSMQQLR